VNVSAPGAMPPALAPIPSTVHPVPSQIGVA